jgi:HD superfamily phosphodiesterase
MDSPLWENLSKFVSHICRDRDDFRGYGHMHQVAVNAIHIYNKLGTHDLPTRDLIIIAAWLHNVADYKYDKDGSFTNLVNAYLHTIYPESPHKIKLIESIIDRMSFSKENEVLKKEEKLDWEEVLGEQGMLIRNIVSDADKLEAIGMMGIERCILYGRDKYDGINDKDLIVKVQEHAEEKLLLLKDHFIRTLPGKKMAELMHQEFVDGLKNIEEVIKRV